MSKCFYSQTRIVLLLTLVISVFLFAPSIALSAQVTLAWDPNDPVPDGYRIYQRTEGQAYDYSHPVWTGAGTTGTVNNLVEDTTYYFVVRAYAGTVESADSSEASYFSAPPQLSTYSISVSDGPNGSISPGNTVTVNGGDDQTFNIIPDPGYRVVDVTVDGSSVGAVTTYTFTNVTSNHSVSASFVTPEDIDDDSDGYTENQGDCDDDNALIHPGAGEICGDGIDQDCNGMDLPCDDNSTITVVIGHTPEADFSDTVQDTFINLNTDVNASNDRLNTYTWPSNMPANAVLIKFDLTQLPAGAQIQSAILTLYQTDAGGDASYDVSVHKVINHNPDLQAATGYSYDGVSTWSENNICYNNIPLAQADKAPAEDINRLDLTAGYKNWEVTAMVQDWVNNPTSNYGMILNSDAVAGSNSYRFFASSEESDPDHRPTLELTYSNQTDLTNPDPESNSVVDAMEHGEVELDHTWTRIGFKKTFVNPVVVTGPISLNGSAPAVVRIKNLDATGFEMRIQEWEYLDGSHSVETVSYLVMEKGSYTLEDGTRIEAGMITTDADDSFQSIAFSEQFNVVPVVMSTICSYNDTQTVTGRMKNVTVDGFNYCMQEQELNAKSHHPEMLGYIAWEPSSGTLGDITFKVGKTANSVKHKLYPIEFEAPFSSAPAFLADMQTTDGGDTANVRYTNRDGVGVDVLIDEEQSKNTETNHTSEVVGYVLLGR